MATAFNRSEGSAVAITDEERTGAPMQVNTGVRCILVVVVALGQACDTEVCPFEEPLLARVGMGLAGRFLQSIDPGSGSGRCQLADTEGVVVFSIERVPLDSDDARALIAAPTPRDDVPTEDGSFELGTTEGTKLVCEPFLFDCVAAPVTADQVTTVNVLIGQSTVFAVIDGGGDVARGPTFSMN